jgi:hypothetical protein
VALIVIWEAADRTCGKRLRPLVLQRRVKVWRRESAHQLVFGVAPPGSEPEQPPLPPSQLGLGPGKTDLIAAPRYLLRA